MMRNTDSLHLVSCLLSPHVHRIRGAKVESPSATNLGEIGGAERSIAVTQHRQRGAGAVLFIELLQHIR
jgi:hypothetical protein